MSDTKVKVAVRVRPMNRRELELNTKCIVEMEGNQTVLHPPPSNNKQGENRKLPKVFAFDYCFWSMDESNTAKYADQQVVFKCLGEGILEKAFQGYNACIFAYGQTGSGKSFSMMGNAEQLGLIPRLCCALFQRITLEQNDSHTFKVEVSYMEIYNEKVRDLLDPKGSRQSLKVREHKVLGPYVDGLSQLAVTCFEDIESLMSEGNKSRTVAATNMNEESSRSHAVFNIIVTQTLYDLQSGNSGEKVSKVSLVDLAGSERVSKTGAAGERLKEGSNINKSLSTLGLVISSLADQAAGKGKNKFVPYRDSVLTWLLKDNLGGNSQTAMIATISPAADNYEETLSTLRYADRAKRIVNHAIVNEDPNARVIRELREEVEKLKEQLSQAEAMKAPELKEKLEESEKLIKELTITWEEKLRKTEEIAQERQKQLESMGISLESSGIKMGEDKCYLVNLNADPALNELLVYYLKDHTRVGADTSQDIQLFGIGIQPEHCEIDIALDGEVSLSPKENARSCVNGTLVCSVTQLWHGDRILWGNNHFFRINLPKRKRRDWFKDSEKEMMLAEHDLDAASEASSEPDYNYEFAQMEVIMKTLNSNDPLQNVVQVLEKQYLEEKRSALEEQRIMYERELEQLRQQLSPERRYQQCGDRLSDAAQTVQQKVNFWSEERDELFRQSLAKLREQIVKANALVREANFLAEEMSKLTDYQVTLQIPAANLSANRKRGAIVSEPAIQVKRKGKSTQVWTIEKLENKLIDMRELYQDWKERFQEMKKLTGKRGDPFYEAQENHNLIGVANVFLECLFCDVKLQYAVPIISQQGEVVGRLHVEVMRVTGAVPERVMEDDSSENSSESGSLEIMDNNGEIIHRPKKLTCRVKIKEATGLPLNLSNFVFCQYTFWDQCESTVAAPVVDPDVPSPLGKDVQFTVTFSHCRDYVVNVTEEFLEFIADGALAIEVWGHRCAENGSSVWEVDSLRAKSRTLRDRWNEVTRQIEMWVSIQELNEIGDYAAVELHQAKDVNTGGIFQLRQGHSRRVQVVVKPVQHSGTLPLMVEAILSVSIGCVTARSTKLQRGLDSYQEEDLNCVREKWSEALIKRKEYLDEQIKKISNKQEKTEDDIEREARLVEQWVGLTEERNAVLVPAPNSGIPGAPANWVPPPGMETHVPVLFLDLNADDLSANEQLIGPHASGVNSILPKEHGSQFFYLPIIKHSKDEISATAAWDSSVHDSVHLNRVTPQNERIYLILKITVQLSHPAAMELVLRKRIAANIYNKQSFTQSLKRRISLKNIWYACGVTYEIVSNIPKATEEIEDRETLALMAARNENEGTSDGETYIEKYIRGVLQVENILSLERLRQAVTVKEAVSAKTRHIQRSISTPNVHNVSSSRLDLSGCDEDKGWLEGHLDVLEFSSSYQDVSCYSTLPRDSPHKNKDNSENPHTSSVSSFKAFSPQPPKFFKPLMPVKEENKKASLETRPLLSKEQDSEDDDDLETNNKKPYVPVEFADFSVYNASLENKEWLSTKGDCINSCVTEKEVSRSPTTSSITSGYFSHSASNATLSDMLIPCSESMDQLASQMRDLDSNDHSVAHLTHVLKSSNQGVSEAERDFAKYKKLVSPIIVTCALATEIQVSESTNVNATRLHCSSLDSSTNKHEIEFPSREATVEHISNVFEDHAFTEFMGVDDAKEFECSASKTSNRRKKFLTAGMNSAIPFSKNVHDQDSALSCLESRSVGYHLSNSIENPLLNAREKEASCCQQYAHSLPAGDFNGKNHLDVPSSEGTTTEGHPNWLAVGEQVYVDANKTGIVRYIGPVDFSTGTWVGIELHVQMGKHDGTIKGREYFHCKPQHGIFVRPECLAKTPAEVKLRSRTSQSQVLSSVEKLKNPKFQGSPSLKAEAFCQSGDAAASAFSRKQEIRKSWIN
ncbi:kinesin-like protein KIF13A isoform X9 [Python bivittatus]|uniref:Kinesin-like protein KIF13A isoform X9 n=1 Tax=Python bivittatus TaxID=176946 RepID=A0A9F3W0F6_PYTBI|nr:kinesin-like protein KIF13A isoform X9 [Python bivittatus]